MEAKHAFGQASHTPPPQPALAEPVQALLHVPKEDEGTSHVLLAGSRLAPKVIKGPI